MSRSHKALLKLNHMSKLKFSVHLVPASIAGAALVMLQYW